MLAATFTIAAINAQEIPERKDDGYRPHAREKMHNKKEMADLNLTEEQKAKFKALNAEHRQQLEDLRKQDNITVKESRERMISLQKDHKAKMQSILTAEQKAKMEVRKKEGAERAKEFGKKRGEKMQQDLGLTEQQKSKLAENRKATGVKLKAIREDKNLTDEQKKEKSKELMKAQKESMKSILTEEQLQKMKEGKKRHGQPGDRKGKEKQTVTSI